MVQGPSSVRSVCVHASSLPSSASTGRKSAPRLSTSFFSAGSSGPRTACSWSSVGPSRSVFAIGAGGQRGDDGGGAGLGAKSRSSAVRRCAAVELGIKREQRFGGLRRARTASAASASSRTRARRRIARAGRRARPGRCAYRASAFRAARRRRERDGDAIHRCAFDEVALFLEAGLHRRRERGSALPS